MWSSCLKNILETSASKHFMIPHSNHPPCLFIQLCCFSHPSSYLFCKIPTLIKFNISPTLCPNKTREKTHYHDHWSYSKFKAMAIPLAVFLYFPTCHSPTLLENHFTSLLLFSSALLSILFFKTPLLIFLFVKMF